MKKEVKKVLLVGGGTGGHVVPIFEVYNKLKSQEEKIKLIVLGAGTEVEKNFFARDKNYKAIRTGKFIRQLTIKNILEFFKFIVGIIQAFVINLRFKPDLIFAKGGYVSLPVIFTAKILKIPYFIHESDIEMGMANKYAYKNAEKIFLGFPQKFYKHIEADKSIYSGQILRDDFIKNKVKNYDRFGFVKFKPVILVTGGSQGSLNINKNFTKILPFLLEKYNIIHQTGNNDFIWVRSFWNSLGGELKDSYYITEFLKDNMMVEAINIADLVIARAGANSVSEFAAKEKAMILIPYKYAAGDHQTKNAELIKKNDAAIVIKDDNLSPDILKEKIDYVFSSESIRNSMGRNARRLFPDNGLDVVTGEIIKKLYKEKSE